MTDPNIKRPPHSNEAEQSVLGGAMMASPQSVAWLTEDDFYRESHRLIWRAIIDLDRSGQQPDAVTVTEWFQRHGKLDKVDSGAYLTKLVNETPGPANLKGYARIVRDKARLRRLIQIGSDVADRAMTEQDPDAIIAELGDVTLDWSSRQLTGPRNLGQISASFIDRLDALEKVENRIETGLLDLDRRIMGFLPSELAVIAGRPGMGKTAMMQGILEHVGRHQAALCFSAEMSGEQILKRMVAQEIDSRKLRDPRELSTAERRQMMANIQRVQRELNILIDDTAGIGINELVARARQAKREHKIGLIAVDYLQLLEARAENRTQEVGLVSRKLKGLAKSLDLPVVVLSQLNRGLESRPDKRPHLGDLRESGQLEQDADIVILLYRHKEYHPEFESDIAELIIPKHRDAETGTELALWEGPRTRFLNATDDAKGEYWAAINAESKPKGKRGSKFKELEAEAS